MAIKRAKRTNRSQMAADLHGRVRDGVEVWYSDLAVKALWARDLARVDVESILGRCLVTKVVEADDEATWLVEGADREGRKLPITLGVGWRGISVRQVGDSESRRTDCESILRFFE